MDVSNNPVEAFKAVADSFAEPTKQGKSYSHKYLTFDSASGKWDTSTRKRDAASFREITELVNDLLILSDRLSDSDKTKILKSYQLITKNFENRKLGFLRNLFFGQIKTNQISQAKGIINYRLYILNAQAAPFKSVLSDYIHSLKQAHLLSHHDLIDFHQKEKISTSDPKALTFEDCHKINRQIILKTHSDKAGGSKEMAQKRLDCWNVFRAGMQRLTGQKEDITPAFLRELDELFG